MWIFTCYRLYKHTYMIRIIQTNLNHCKAAQDLLAQTEIEKSIGISIIAEPYNVPDGNSWMSSLDGRAAIHITNNMLIFGVTKRRGRFSVSYLWKKLIIISAYISPNESIETYEEFLDELDTYIQDATEDVLICEDFNSKAILWGCKYNCPRGDHLLYWISSRDMIRCNVGNKPTCIRHQGTSIIDLTWCNSTLKPCIENWSVLEEETLSDHVYIYFDINYNKEKYRQKKKKYVRWSHKKLEEDRFREAIEWSCIGVSLDTYIQEDDTELLAKWIQDTISEACDYSMPRARTFQKDSVYWWDPKFEDLRKKCQSTRKKW